ncbi:MAG: hypothetical protein WCK58_14445 [Chloroflexota bacterium]
MRRSGGASFVLGLVLVLGACTSAQAEAKARELALKFYMGAHVPGAKLENVQVVDAKEATRDCPGGWAVQIWGNVTEPGAGVSYSNPMWLCVDPVSGKVTITAQG